MRKPSGEVNLYCDT